MILKFIRLSILVLIMLNIPGWILENINPTLASALSYLSYGLMVLYYMLRKNWTLNFWMIFLGLGYFGISSLSGQLYQPEFITYLIIIVKFFIVIIGGYSILQDTSKSELLIILVLGSFSVFLQMFVFYNAAEDYGRYSGFYINPNGLGFICMMGYGLTFGITGKWRTYGQIIFSFIGFLTFSRTFIIVWLLMNVLSIKLSLKNIRVLALGLFLFIGLITFNAFLPKSNPRLEAMSSIIMGKSTNTSRLEEGGRTETWAEFYPYLFAKPIFGNGYGAFGGGGVAGFIGSHNSFLKIWGEAGILVFLFFLLMLLKMLKHGYAVIMQNPHIFLMSLALSLFLLTNHNFFDVSYLLFFTMWIQHQITLTSNSEKTERPKKILFS